jgi:predicted nucleotidyltransferase component of viral defense system
MTRILNEFSGISSISKNFYLAGGTGLALQLGHRRSLDLDFFSEKNFDMEITVNILTGLSGKITYAEENTIYSQLYDIKVSFIYYPYPVLMNFILFNRIKIAGIGDISCMKAIAISQRAEKKDFFDMFEILKTLKPSAIRELMLKKYGEDRINCYHILKSFFYFSDAEDSVEPVSLNNTSWKDVKNYFISNEKILRNELMCDES